MGLKYKLYVTLKRRHELAEVSNNISKKEGKCRVGVYLDVLHSLYKYGTIPTEFQALNFTNRSSENRKSFVTVLWLTEQLDKYNPQEYRKFFHDKRLFNSTFSEFLNRDWMPIEGITDELKSFLAEHNKVVMKNASGCSGKQVYVSNEDDTTEKLLCMIKEDGFNLIEESIVNAPPIRAFNPTSLNTIRIVTVRSGDYFNIICACLRIGAKGATVDNVSCGGTSARINVETHKLDSVFFANAYREIPESQVGRNDIGFEIPFWSETVDLVTKASLKVPQIHIVGWDVAITPNGPALIEGNESFHTVVMQLYASVSEPGIKEAFAEALAHIH